MERRFKILLAALPLLLCCSLGFAREQETIVSGQTSDALAMLEQRFSSLSGSLGKMPETPKLSGTLALPPQMEGKVSLPGGSAPSLKEGEKHE